MTDLFQTLDEDPAITSPRHLTPAAQKELDFFLDRLQKSNLPKFVIGENLFIFSPKDPYTTAHTQLSGCLDWVYLHKKQYRLVVFYLELISELIIKARVRMVSLLNFDPEQ